MIFHIWLLIFVVVSVLLGTFWMLIREPVMRRLRAEAALAKEEKLHAQQIAEARKAAEEELNTLLEVPSEATPTQKPTLPKAAEEAQPQVQEGKTE